MLGRQRTRSKASLAAATINRSSASCRPKRSALIWAYVGGLPETPIAFMSLASLRQR